MSGGPPEFHQLREQQRRKDDRRLLPIAPHITMTCGCVVVSDRVEGGIPRYATVRYCDQHRIGRRRQR
jgi:hypothetical protein